MMIFPKLIGPDSKIKSDGKILNGRIGLRDALEIREANQLQRQPKQDRVLESLRTK